MNLAVSRDLESPGSVEVTNKAPLKSVKSAFFSMNVNIPNLGAHPTLTYMVNHYVCKESC